MDSAHLCITPSSSNNCINYVASIADHIILKTLAQKTATYASSFLNEFIAKYRGKLVSLHQSERSNKVLL